MLRDLFVLYEFIVFLPVCTEPNTPRCTCVCSSLPCWPSEESEDLSDSSHRSTTYSNYKSGWSRDRCRSCERWRPLRSRVYSAGGKTNQERVNCQGKDLNWLIFFSLWFNLLRCSICCTCCTVNVKPRAWWTVWTSSFSCSYRRTCRSGCRNPSWCLHHPLEPGRLSWSFVLLFWRDEEALKSQIYHNDGLKLVCDSLEAEGAARFIFFRLVKF